MKVRSFMPNASFSINKLLAETNQKLEDFKKQVTQKPETISETKINNLVTLLEDSQEAITTIDKRLKKEGVIDQVLAKKILDAIFFIQHNKTIPRDAPVQAALAALDDLQKVLQNHVDKKGLKRGTKVEKVDNDSQRE